jgi:hypothetical protein
VFGVLTSGASGRRVDAGSTDRADAHAWGRRVTRASNQDHAVVRSRNGDPWLEVGTNDTDDRVVARRWAV